MLTWREIGVNMCRMCWWRPRDYVRYAPLPDWARRTLTRRRRDRRPRVYSLADLGAWRTPDPLWNAAQTPYTA